MSTDSNDKFAQLAKEHPKWAALQQEMAKKVIIPEKDGYFPEKQDIILSLDIQYKGDKAHVAGDVLHWQGEHIGTFAGLAEVDTPYIPSYFCFREGPPLLRLIKKLERETLIPDLIIVDGHGLAHPRRFGVACWLGVTLDIPTIGCAKETLLRYEGNLDDDQGSVVSVTLEQDTVGYVLRNQDKINPIFVSPGHKVSLENSHKIIVNLPGPYRIPDTLRRADQAARGHCKGIVSPDWQSLKI